MDIETLRKMKLISKKEIERFIESGSYEYNYFNINKEGLITLSEYLKELQSKKEEYNNKTKKYVDSIKEKNDWVIDVQPSFNRRNIEIIAIAGNYPNIGVSESKTGHFRVTGGYTETSLFIARVKKREKIVENSPEELKEIKNILSNYDYEREKTGIITSSEYFLINPEDFNSIEIRSKDRQLYKLFLSDDRFKVYNFFNKKTTDDVEEITKKFSLKK